MTRSLFAGSTTFKLFVLGALSLLLLIPLSLIYGLVRERASLASEAETRIAAGWGREQDLLLPMLRFDYARERSNKDNELIRERRWLLLSAAEARVRASLGAESRQLGIYALPIYTAKVSIDAQFDRRLLGGGVLAALYGFLLVLIQAEELSLLLGAIGLALLLATAMYLTRRLDWYSAAPEATADASDPTP